MPPGACYFCYPLRLLPATTGARYACCPLRLLFSAPAARYACCSPRLEPATPGARRALCLRAIRRARVILPGPCARPMPPHEVHGRSAPAGACPRASHPRVIAHPGPVLGGTTLTLSGSHLDGSLPRCGLSPTVDAPVLHALAAHYRARLRPAESEPWALWRPTPPWAGHLEAPACAGAEARLPRAAARGAVHTVASGASLPGGGSSGSLN